MNSVQTLESLGLQLPGPWYIFGCILFSIIGYAVYRYGKKKAVAVPKWIGIALMLYPYVVTETWLLYVCGVGLSIAAYVYRNR